jgi:hypothetical protein
LIFDAVRIVSYGADDKLIITELMTGNPLQVVHKPHEGSRILAMQFDTDYAVTVSGDRMVRFWTMKGARFSIRETKQSMRPKMHIVGGSEQLQDIARRYDLRVRDLLKWNNLVDAHTVYVGMRLSLYSEEELADMDEKDAQNANAAAREEARKRRLEADRRGGSNSTRRTGQPIRRLTLGGMTEEQAAKLDPVNAALKDRLAKLRRRMQGVSEDNAPGFTKNYQMKRNFVGNDIEFGDEF